MAISANAFLTRLRLDHRSPDMHRSRLFALPGLIAATLFCARPVRAQEASATPTFLARCDSIIAASRADSVTRGLYLSTVPINSDEVSLKTAQSVNRIVATSIDVPRPLRMPVLEGPVQMSALRRRDKDSSSALRAPVINGVYRFTWTRPQRVTNLVTARSSLVPGLDSAVLAAIQTGFGITGAVQYPVSDDSLRLELRLSSDSSSNALRLAALIFPRMPVVDAVPSHDNPPAQFPDSVEDEVSDDVVLRFVVDPDGGANDQTVEVVRAPSLEFVRAAFLALPMQRFTPASVRGCPVAQQIYYPFAFIKRLPQ